MAKQLRRWCMTGAAGLMLLAAAPHTYSDPALDEARQLLQKSLTVYELDQEIARLNDQEAKLAQQIADSDTSIAEKGKQVDETRSHAGKVLRAYYMGDRISIWVLLFSAKSFSDALVVYDYLSMIAQNDQRSLTSYQTAYRQLQDLRKQQEDSKAELDQVRNDFITQRDRAVALQKQVDEQLAASTQAAALKEQMDQLTAAWQEKGIPLFRTYFKAISGAMQSLPELLKSGSGTYLTGTLTAPVFQITDAQLNDFFRSKNPIFNNMKFTFADGQFLAAGQDGDTAVSIKGRYTVENDPQNKLQFHVDELTFNGYTLPDTTNRQLENEFDLGFSPENYFPAKATDITLEDGKLTIKLKLSSSLK